LLWQEPEQLNFDSFFQDQLSNPRTRVWHSNIFRSLH